MFSTGHLLWIAVSAALILGGLIAVKARKPDLRQVLKACLIVGAASEAVKVFSVMNILPMVTPAVAGGEIAYIPAGQYSPYIEMAHLPLELCSLMLVFLAAALLLRDGIWRERLLTVMYITGLIGGLILLAVFPVSCHGRVPGALSGLRSQKRHLAPQPENDDAGHHDPGHSDVLRQFDILAAGVCK